MEVKKSGIKQNSTQAKCNILREEETNQRIRTILARVFLELLAIFLCSFYSLISTRTLHREREREGGWSRVFLEVFFFGAVCVKIGYMEKVGKVIQEICLGECYDFVRHVFSGS